VWAAIFLASLSGCAAAHWWKAGEDDFEKATARNPAVQIACLWQPAEGRGLDGLPARGFAGQIIFLTQSSPTPVTVDGDVRIFLFEDQGTYEEQVRPIHQFDFVDGAWATHLRPTAWGAAYQIFLPYVRKGHHEAKCSLRVRLKPKEGPTIFSEFASVTLPGKSLTPAARDETTRFSHATSSAYDASGRQGPASKHIDRPLDSQSPKPKRFEAYTIPQY
jgi:hypothetical protein